MEKVNIILFGLRSSRMGTIEQIITRHTNIFLSKTNSHLPTLRLIFFQTFVVLMYLVFICIIFLQYCLTINVFSLYIYFIVNNKEICLNSLLEAYCHVVLQPSVKGVRDCIKGQMFRPYEKIKTNHFNDHKRLNVGRVHFKTLNNL